jgi:catechol 2,3-dioxygenase-like lactoylglutathione lyase family enzyme
MPMGTIRYIVKDVDAAVDFFVSSLGFTLEQQFGPAMAILKGQGIQLWLAGPPASASQPMPDGSLPEPGGWNRLVITVDDIHETVEELREAGVTFRNEVFTGPGGSQILCEDPSGNPIEIFQPAQGQL